MGAQDETSVETYNDKGCMEQLHSMDENAWTVQVGQNHYQLTYSLSDSDEYIHTLYRLSRERENTTSIQQLIRLLNKSYSCLLLREHNMQQKICKLVSDSQILSTSSLHYRFAHLIYLLRKIVI